MSTVDLALFDDHPVLLDGLSTLLSECSDFTVVGTGSSAYDAVSVSTSRKVDVALVDLGMPGNVYEAIQSLRAKAPDTKILVFTASVAIDHAVRALEAGAHGYVLKGSTIGELTDAIRAVFKGETYLTQSFALKVISALRNTSARKAALHALQLSLREEQVVRLLLRGKTNREIADSLKISEKTVKYYMSVLMQKMHARNRIEVVLAAQRLNGESFAGSDSSGWNTH
jgi:DNA-binding NarL/FixJ family response regulator